jgi:penicillin-binding protein 2
MYALMTSISQDAIDLEEFEARYRTLVAEAALQTMDPEADRYGLDYGVLSNLTNPRNAQVNYRLILHSILVGDIQRDNVMNLALEDGEWRVQWDESLLLPELSGGERLSMDVRIPSRGNIYDRDGHAIVAQADAVALGLDTSRVDPDQVDALLNEIWRLTGIRPESLRQTLETYQQYGWYLPIGEVAQDVVAPRDAVLAGFDGMVMRAFRSRYYFDGGIAPQVVGYVSAIQPEEVEEYKRRGYRVDEKVGRMGLERWGEGYLSGDRGGSLYVVGPEGDIITKLAEAEPQPAASIYTTLDKDLQTGAEIALQGFRGAIVVLERDSGRVLAMASSPGFDPNAFEPNNINYQYLLDEIFADDAGNPLLNRATQGQYPLGSVFKIVTMAAALESGVYTPESEYQCGYQFTELQGVVLNDWTYEHFQEDGRTQPSGLLTLPEGLMRSCNPFFWHIGLDLYTSGLTEAIAEMAKGFGLGQPTGIGQVAEAEGQIPVPGSQLEATNNAIGQGDTQVTPLQVARFVAAVGNGGTLYRPQIVERIEPPGGQPLFAFRPEPTGVLPVDQEILEVIQSAMVSVVEDPRGTARHIFPNFPIPIAGKTGTAQDPPRDPHAWFAGYTFAGREDVPDIAIAVIVENSGEGSDFAAPIFKGIVQLYYTGQRSKFPWESQPGVLSSPTPEVTETPVVEETPTPEG